MVFVFDIDQTILDSEYKNSEYIIKGFDFNMLIAINNLYSQGHTIIMQTARHWDKFELTQKQLEGCSYHSLVMGNIPADYYINDKNLTPETFIDLYKSSNFNQEEENGK